MKYFKFVLATFVLLSTGVSAQDVKSFHDNKNSKVKAEKIDGATVELTEKMIQNLKRKGIIKD